MQQQKSVEPDDYFAEKMMPSFGLRVTPHRGRDPLTLFSGLT
jgi:hypothetical protein